MEKLDASCICELTRIVFSNSSHALDDEGDSFLGGELLRNMGVEQSEENIDSFLRTSIL